MVLSGTQAPADGSLVTLAVSDRKRGGSISRIATVKTVSAALR